MDTVNKVVTAASTAIWGEDGSQSQQSAQQHGDEPLSGVQGKGVANDPYDAGNRDEQPNAPSTDVNTASQHPTVAGESKNASSETAATSTKSIDETPNGLAEASNPNYAAEASNPSSGASSTEKKPTEDTEQRSTTLSESESASSGGESSSRGPPASHDVSKEALEGPQGPAPHPAEEYEKETKGQKPAKKEEPAKSSDSSGSPSKGSEKSEHGSGSGGGSGNGSGGSAASEKSNGSGDGKHNTMSKVKETLHKVAHPRHGSKE